ncbi:MAG: AlpA family phage regulatory protein [Pseudomonadota bacterium]
MQPNQQLLTAKDVMTATGIRARSTLWRKCKAREFPAPVEIGSNRIRWLSRDVDQWIETRQRRLY